MVRIIDSRYCQMYFMVVAYALGHVKKFLYIILFFFMKYGKYAYIYVGRLFLISFLLIVVTHSFYIELVLSPSEQSLPNAGTRKLFWTLCRCT